MRRSGHRGVASGELGRLKGEVFPAETELVVEEVENILAYLPDVHELLTAKLEDCVGSRDTRIRIVVADIIRAGDCDSTTGTKTASFTRTSVVRYRRSRASR